jgi:hypothetical protein
LAGALLLDEKIRKSAALFWFGLGDVGILYSPAVIQRTIDVSPACLSRRRLDSFVHEAAQNLNSYQILSIKNKKSKTSSG